MSREFKPLEGIKVVEMANFIAAASAGRLLADLGADVIKIEAANGDPLRFTAPGEGRPLDWYENTTWDTENTNKRGISINIKHPKGKEALFKLLDEADVFITNWRVQALERQGLDYASLKERFPKLVYAICTGYGEYGPDKDLPGFDFTAFFARGGYFENLRQATDRPFNGAPGIGDHNVGMVLAAGILAALYQAKTRGVGEKVETSLLECAVFNHAMMVAASNYDGIAQRHPVDVRDGANPFNAAWRTSDNRYIQTCMPNYNQYYNAFMAAIGRADLVDNENYFPLQTAQAKGLTQEVYDIINAAMGEKTVAEWKPILVAADIPFAVCQNWSEIRQDPQAEANNCFYDMEYYNGNVRRLVRTPVRMQEMGTPDYKKGPMIGEHSEEVLAELGYSAEEIAEMRADGAFVTWEDAAAKFGVEVK